MRVLVDPAREALAGLLREIVRGSDREGRDSRVLVCGDQGPGLIVPGGVAPGPAERALVGVHRSELARLLREAARAALGDAALAPAALRAALREALRCARADGLRLAAPVTDLVRACLCDEGDGDPARAAELALASLRVEESLAGRGILAAALAACGDPGGASVVLAAALLTLSRLGAAVPGRRRALVDALVGAQVAAGERRRARRLARLAGELEGGRA